MSTVDVGVVYRRGSNFLQRRRAPQNRIHNRDDRGSVDINVAASTSPGSGIVSKRAIHDVDASGMIVMVDGPAALCRGGGGVIVEQAVLQGDGSAVETACAALARGVVVEDAVSHREVSAIGVKGAAALVACACASVVQRKPVDGTGFAIVVDERDGHIRGQIIVQIARNRGGVVRYVSLVLGGLGSRESSVHRIAGLYGERCRACRRFVRPGCHPDFGALAARGQGGLEIRICVAPGRTVITATRTASHVDDRGGVRERRRDIDRAVHGYGRVGIGAGQIAGPALECVPTIGRCGGTEAGSRAVPRPACGGDRPPLGRIRRPCPFVFRIECRCQVRILRGGDNMLLSTAVGPVLPDITCSRRSGLRWRGDIDRVRRVFRPDKSPTGTGHGIHDEFKPGRV